MSELISLTTRISFYDGPPTNGSIPWSTSGTFGMSGSSLNGVVIKLDLTGTLSSTIAGRLLCGPNTMLSIPVVNYSLTGIVNIYAFNIDTYSLTYAGYITIEQNTRVINIDINKFYEKDGILYAALVPIQSSSGHYVEFSSTNCSLLVNNVLTTMPAFSIINEQTDLDGHTVLYRCRKDIVSVEVSIPSLSFNNLLAKVNTSHFVDESNDSPYVVWNFTYDPFVTGACNTSSLMTLQGFVSYGGVDYTSNLVSFQCKIKCLLPLLIRYSPNETTTSRVFKMYYPGSVITHGQDSSFKVPLIVAIHGGLWSSGEYHFSGDNVTPLNAFVFEKWEKDNSYDSNAQNCASGDDFYIRNLLRLGFAVCLMDYTGVNYNGTCSTMLSDINLLMNFLFAKHVQLHININKLCLWGYSSGGHLALLYSYLSKIQNNTFNVSCPFDIKLVVSEAGPTDMSFIPKEDSTHNGVIDNYYDLNYACDFYGIANLVEDFNTYRREMVNAAWKLCGVIDLGNNINPGNFVDFDNISNYPDWVLKTTTISPITYASSQSPCTFLSYSPCDSYVYNCHAYYLMDLLNVNTCIFHSAICNHEEYSYEITNEGGLLEEALIIYKNQ